MVAALSLQAHLSVDREVCAHVYSSCQELKTVNGPDVPELSLSPGLWQASAVACALFAAAGHSDGYPAYSWKQYIAIPFSATYNRHGSLSQGLRLGIVELSGHSSLNISCQKTPFQWSSGKAWGYVILVCL